MKVKVKVKVRMISYLEEVMKRSALMMNLSLITKKRM